MLTTMTVHTNKMYVKKSPGWENLGDAFSSLLPYVYTVPPESAMVPVCECLWYIQKYVSNMMPNFGPVMRNDVMSRHTCGGSCMKVSLMNTT